MTCSSRLMFTSPSSHHKELRFQELHRLHQRDRSDSQLLQCPVLLSQLQPQAPPAHQQSTLLLLLPDRLVHHLPDHTGGRGDHFRYDEIANQTSSQHDLPQNRYSRNSDSRTRPDLVASSTARRESANRAPALLPNLSGGKWLAVFE